MQEPTQQAEHQDTEARRIGIVQRVMALAESITSGIGKGLLFVVITYLIVMRVNSQDQEDFLNRLEGVLDEIDKAGTYQEREAQIQANFAEMFNLSFNNFVWGEESDGLTRPISVNTLKPGEKFKVITLEPSLGDILYPSAQQSSDLRHFDLIPGVTTVSQLQDYLFQIFGSQLASLDSSVWGASFGLSVTVGDGAVEVILPLLSVETDGNTEKIIYIQIPPYRHDMPNLGVDGGMWRVIDQEAGSFDSN